jgi:uncharacterized protein
MSQRDHYEPGVPCWVDTLQPNAPAAMEFYGGVFGWEFVPLDSASEGAGEYFVARFRTHAVAGVGAQTVDGAPQGSAWNTYVAVAAVDDAVERARSAGGTLVGGSSDLSSAARVAYIRDPTGAVIGMWEAKLRHGAELVNDSPAWVLSQLRTTDCDTVEVFYSAVFGWQPEPFALGEREITLCRLPGYVGGVPDQPVPRDVVAIIRPIEPDQGQPHWSVNFWIDDVDAAAVAIPRMGGRVISEPRNVPGSRTAVFSDPSGAVFMVDTVDTGQDT